MVAREPEFIRSTALPRPLVITLDKLTGHTHHFYRSKTCPMERCNVQLFGLYFSHKEEDCQYRIGSRDW